MNERQNSARCIAVTTRRQLISGVAITLGSLAPGFRVWGETQQAAMKELPSAAENQKRTSLHQEAEYKVSPERLYEVLLDSKQFAECTGRPAEIDPKEGGAFSLFEAQIVGRNVELVPNQRIVQAWRPAHWDPGIYSIVRFELRAQGTATILLLDHTGFPEGNFDHLNSGWQNHYIEPLKKFLA